ncbi:MAG: hemolysin family protein [Acidobacteriota bacterium]
MILGLTVLALLMALLVTVVTCVQLFYLESMRIRSRDLPSLQYFKETLEPKIGLDTEHGAVTFSIVKHTGLGILGCLIFGITLNGAEMWQAFAGACLLSSLVAIFGAHLIPQVVYRKTSAHAFLALVPVLRLIAFIAKPLTWSLEFLSSLFDLSSDHPDQAASSEEPIEALINAGEEEGIIEKGDRELIQSVVAFGDKTVREVLTPRPRVVGIPQNASLEQLRKLAIDEQYSRVPAYDRDIDAITGFVHVRDMFELDEETRAKKTVRDILRPIRAIPESKPVTQLMREMQEEGGHMAVVVDEYGSTAGIVTMEDLVEEIVGEIHDEHEPDRDYHQNPDGSYTLSGSFDLDRLRELLGFQKPEGTESTTVGGLMTEWLGHVPVVGETIERDAIQIKVTAASNLRVDQVQVAKLEAPTEPEDPAPEL